MEDSVDQDAQDCVQLDDEASDSDLNENNLKSMVDATKGKKPNAGKADAAKTAKDRFTKSRTQLKNAVCSHKATQKASKTKTLGMMPNSPQPSGSADAAVIQDWVQLDDEASDSEFNQNKIESMVDATKGKKPNAGKADAAKTAKDRFTKSRTQLKNAVHIHKATHKANKTKTLGMPPISPQPSGSAEAAVIQVTLSDWHKMLSETKSAKRKLAQIGCHNNKRKRYINTDKFESDSDSVEEEADDFIVNSPIGSDADDASILVDKLMASDTGLEHPVDDDNNNLSDLDEIQQDFDASPELGDPLPDKMVNLFHTLVKGNISDKKLSEKFTMYKKPKNLDLDVAKVNPELWAIMDRDSKTSDLRLQKVQRSLYVASYALSLVATKCTESKDVEAKALLKPVADAAGLVLKSAHDLNIDRRLRVVSAPHFDKKYKKLATSDVPVTKYLFGDNLQAEARSIDSASRLGKNFQYFQSGPKKGFKGKFGYRRTSSAWRRTRGKGRSAYANFNQNQYRNQNPYNPGLNRRGRFMQQTQSQRMPLVKEN